MEAQITTQPIPRLFARYVLASVLGMAGVAAYTLADTFFLANAVGLMGMAGLNIVVPVYCLMAGLSAMIATGAATHLGIAKGKGDEGAYSRLFTSALCIAALAGAAISLPMALCPGALARMLGASQEVLPYARAYFMGLSAFPVLLFVNNTLAAFVRNDGNPKLAMVAQLVGTFANIALDWLFLYPMDLGMLGAGMATTISPMLGILVLLPHWCKGASRIRLMRKAISSRVMAAIARTGTPALTGEVCGGVLVLACNLIATRLAGDLGLAAYGLLFNSLYIGTTMLMGIGNGIQPLVSANYGAGRMGRCFQALGLGFALAAVAGLVMYAGACVFAEPLVAVFNSDNNAEMAALAVDGLYRFYALLPFQGLNLVLIAFFTAVDQTRPAFLLSFARGFALALPCVLVLTALMGLNGLWLASPICELLVCALACALALRMRARIVKNRAPRYGQANARGS